MVQLLRPTARVARAVCQCSQPARRFSSSPRVRDDLAAAQTFDSAPASTGLGGKDAPLGLKQREKKKAWDEMMMKVDARRARRLADAQFAQLGSTQNRQTTWQPHQTLLRPPTPVSLTQSHLVAAGAHLGHSPSLTHRAALPLIYGTRASLSYIDLRQTLPALRRAAQIVRGVVERDGIVVFVGSLKGAERAVWENAKRLGENGYGVTKWLPGTISNAKEVFGWCEIPEVEGEWTKASPLSFKPSLLVLLSPTLNQHAVREATANEVPTIGICDTDVDPRSVTYSIPANDDSPRAIELIAGVLGMAGKDGLERKLARHAAEDAKRASRTFAESAARQGRQY
ncbi:hypothetical protein RQP46_004654 [Phenoliferia psychrophenolica]